MSRLNLEDSIIFDGSLKGATKVDRDDLTDDGAASVSTFTTAITTTGAAAITLADGVENQIKALVMVADGGDATITPANFGNGSTLTFADVGDSAILQFIAGDWWLLTSNGGTVA